MAYNPFNTDKTQGGWASMVGRFELESFNEDRARYGFTDNNGKNYVVAQIGTKKDGTWQIAVYDSADRIATDPTNVEKFAAATPQEAFDTAEAEMVRRGIRANTFAGQWASK